jgi:hypothetical protein
MLETAVVLPQCVKQLGRATFSTALFHLTWMDSTALIHLTWMDNVHHCDGTLKLMPFT